jgi:hypothetical protein
MTATTSTTTIAATTTGRRIIIRKNKTCEKCGIERKTMHTRQDQNLLFAWAEPYQDLCPYCYLQEEEASGYIRREKREPQSGSGFHPVYNIIAKKGRDC